MERAASGPPVPCQAVHRYEPVVMQSLLAQGMGEAEVGAAVDSVATVAHQFERAFFGVDAQ